LVNTLSLRTNISKFGKNSFALLANTSVICKGEFTYAFSIHDCNPLFENINFIIYSIVYNLIGKSSNVRLKNFEKISHCL
jgi:hypothetical protein